MNISPIVKQKIKFIPNSKLKEIKEIFKNEGLIAKSCPMKKGDISHSKILIEYNLISHYKNYKSAYSKLKEMRLI